MYQEQLEELLKKKGIGPQGSKSLKKEELEETALLLKNPEVSLTTKATMLTALLLLPPAPDEKNFIDALQKNPQKYLPLELRGYILYTDDAFLNLIKKVIGKNELTKEECISAMTYLFSEGTPDFFKGAFLEAERLKRETFSENESFLNFLFKKISHYEIDTPVLIDIADSYDGSKRSRNFSLFTAALLGSIGIPALVHGIDSVAPKQGYTSHQILKASGKNPLISVEQAVKNIKDQSIGWTYLDQQIFFPELYKMKKMRKEMVKRPFLATFEKLLQPIQSRNGNHIVTGFTHPHYKEELVKQLKNQNECCKAVILKGVEGSTHMSLSKETICVVYDGKSISETLISPENFTLSPMEMRVDKNVTAKNCYEEGIAALKGEKNYARENILYLTLVIIEKFELMKMNEAKDLLSSSLTTGKALKHFNNHQ